MTMQERIDELTKIAEELNNKYNAAKLSGDEVSALRYKELIVNILVQAEKLKEKQASDLASMFSDSTNNLGGNDVYDEEKFSTIELESRKLEEEKEIVGPNQESKDEVGNTTETIPVEQLIEEMTNPDAKLSKKAEKQFAKKAKKAQKELAKQEKLAQKQLGKETKAKNKVEEVVGEGSEKANNISEIILGILTVIYGVIFLVIPKENIFVKYRMLHFADFLPTVTVFDIFATTGCIIGILLAVWTLVNMISGKKLYFLNILIVLLLLAVAGGLQTLPLRFFQMRVYTLIFQTGALVLTVLLILKLKYSLRR